MNGISSSLTGEGSLSLWVGPAGVAAAELGAGDDSLLAGVRFGGTATPSWISTPLFDVPNLVLSGEPWLVAWRTGDPVRRGRAGDFDFATTGEVLFGGCRRPLDSGVEAGTYALYRDLLALADEAGCPSLLRIWNYLPRINEEEGRLERYRHFNAGRARALAERSAQIAERSYCASSAVGAPGGELVTCFLAAREGGVHLENPRQLPAWRYPLDHGPVSPTFARATLVPAALGGTLLISGTASIVGHESRHPGDLVSQIDETLANLEAVLERARHERGGGTGEGLSALDFVKVYLRHPGDLAAARNALASRLPASVPVLYLEADICRAELLVEIEGIAF